MLKKVLIGTSVLAVMGAFVFGRDAFSYARTWGRSIREAVKAEVPIEFEVQRAREMVEKIVPDIRECMHVIAEQQVDVAHRTQEIERRGFGLAQQKNAIMTLQADLKSGESTFRYASRSYTSREVKRDLSLRFTRYKSAEESLGRDRQILAAREKALRANEQKLDSLIVAKKELEVQIEQLEARLKTVEAAKVTSELEFDDSRLSRTKKLIADLNKQLDVQVVKLDMEGKFSGLIPVNSRPEPEVENITHEIDDYFSPSEKDEKPSTDVADVPITSLEL